MLETRADTDPELTDTKVIPPLLTLFDGDACVASHGIVLLQQSPTYSRLEMRVRADMLNPHGTCHGGITFLLADTALAYAAGGAVVTTSAHIIYSAPASAGDMLTAECTAIHQGKKSGVFDVTITKQDGTEVALIRGQTLAFGAPTRPKATPGTT